MGDLAPLDSVVLGILAVATVRGLFIGLIREGFSIAALGGGLVAIRYASPPLSEAIQSATDGALGSTASTWLAGGLVAVAVVAVVGVAGRALRRGARAVGLGWADRIGGGVVGAIEGCLVAAVLLVGTTWVAGADSPLVTESKSVEVLEQLQTYVADHRDELPAVASPPDWLRTSDERDER